MAPNNSISVAGVAAIAAFTSFAILLVLLRTGWAWVIAVDVPNHRSLHVRPVPRVGGCGVMPVALGLILLTVPSLRWLAVGAAVLAVLSQIDDRRGLSVRVRFTVHISVALLAVVSAGAGLAWPLAVLAIVTLVWLINLYNFMDGLNGLAGGMTVIGFAAYAIAAMPDQWPLAAAAGAVAGAGAGFLVLNFNQAKIFLGDAGSVPLGFLAGALGLWGWRRGVWPVWFPAVVFSPFILDATVTLLRRAMRKEKIWQAHREHYYQRLVQMNGSHVRTALSYYAAMAGASAVALAARHLDFAQQWLLVLAWVVVLAVGGWDIDRRWRRYVANRASG